MNFKKYWTKQKERKISEHDIVTLKVKLSDVPSGSKGTVIHVYPNNKTYEVEFIKSGNFSVVKTLLKEHLEVS